MSYLESLKGVRRSRFPYVSQLKQTKLGKGKQNHFTAVEKQFFCLSYRDILQLLLT